MSEELLKYKVEKIVGEGYIASCLVNPNISVFHKDNGEKLVSGIHKAVRLYAKSHPNDDNKNIRDDKFTMKLVE